VEDLTTSMQQPIEGHHNPVVKNWKKAHGAG